MDEFEKECQIWSSKLVVDLFERYVSLTEEKKEKFRRYLELINTYPRNITSIRQPLQIIIKHFIDSLTLLRYLPNSTATLVDIGTGAGFPGVPLKISAPHLLVYLLESSKKYIDFLNLLLKELGVDCVVLCGRAEEYGKGAWREYFDFATGRAVAPLPTLIELAIPLLKVGGQLLVQKGKNYKQEIQLSQNALNQLNSKIISIEKIILPILKHKRYIVCIYKISQTPSKYPRRVGMPGKRPL